MKVYIHSKELSTQYLSITKWKKRVTLQRRRPSRLIECPRNETKGSHIRPPPDTECSKNHHFWDLLAKDACGSGGAQSCLTLCDPMDCSPPGPSVHRISQARILEWVAISSSRGSSRPKDRTLVSYISCKEKDWLFFAASLGLFKNEKKN